jgi:hypothetical protein
MCSVAGQHDAPPSPRTSALVRFTVSSTLSSRGEAASSSGRCPAIVNVRRERCRTPPRYSRLAARVGIDVADLVEEAEAVVVPQHVHASLVGLSVRHDLVQFDFRDGGLSGQRRETSCR